MPVPAAEEAQPEEAGRVEDGKEVPEEGVADEPFIEELTDGVVLNDGSILILFDGRVYHFPPEIAEVMLQVEQVKGRDAPSWHIAKLKELIEEIGAGDRFAFTDFLKPYRVQVDLKDPRAVQLMQVKAAGKEAWKVAEVGLAGNPFTALALAAFYLGYGTGLSLEDREEAKRWVKAGLFLLASTLLAWGAAKYGPRVFGRVKAALRRIQRSPPSATTSGVAEGVSSRTPRGGIPPSKPVDPHQPREVAPPGGHKAGQSAGGPTKADGWGEMAPEGTRPAGPKPTPSRGGASPSGKGSPDLPTQTGRSLGAATRRYNIQGTEHFLREGQKFEGRLVAEGRGIREVDGLVRDFGGTKSGWRKMSQKMLIESERTGEVVRKEIHWYEHHGVGRVDFKIKVPD